MSIFSVLKAIEEKQDRYFMNFDAPYEGLSLESILSGERVAISLSGSFFLPRISILSEFSQGLRLTLSRKDLDLESLEYQSKKLRVKNVGN